MINQFFLEYKIFFINYFKKINNLCNINHATFKKSNLNSMSAIKNESRYFLFKA
jgi:hypothetical protein